MESILAKYKDALQVSQCNHCPAKKTSCSWTGSCINICHNAGYSLRALADSTTHGETEPEQQTHRRLPCAMSVRRCPDLDCLLSTEILVRLGRVGGPPLFSPSRFFGGFGVAEEGMATALHAASTGRCLLSNLRDWWSPPTTADAGTSGAWGFSVCRGSEKIPKAAKRCNAAPSK